MHAAVLIVFSPRSQKKEKRKDKKHKKDKREKRPVERSIITGKRIKREKEEDAEGDARRSALLAHYNEGEDQDVAAAFAFQSQRGSTASASDVQQRAQQALSDPAMMRQLMQQSHEAQQAKRQRLSALHHSANSSVGGGLATVGDEFGAHYLGAESTARPHDYKRERAANERDANRGS